jgi:pilus assembly protein CpaD
MDHKHRTRKRAFALAVAGVACTSLSGCVNELMLAYFGASSLYLYTHPEATEEDWSEVRTQREPQAEMVQYRHDVEFSPGEFTMSPAEGQRLSSFLTRVDVGYGDTVVMMAEPAEGAGFDTASRLTERRAATVSDFLAINRIDARDLLNRVGESPTANNAVTVVVRRHVVALPACPDWTDNPGDNSSNQTSSNWSCATATNLGLMVADPGDLARGRDPGYADGERQAMSIENYRKGETAPLRDDVATQDTFEAGGGFRSNAPTGSGSN